MSVLAPEAFTIATYIDIMGVATHRRRACADGKVFESTWFDQVCSSTIAEYASYEEEDGQGARAAAMCLHC